MAQALAKLVKATLLVVDAGRNRYGPLEGAVKRLRVANATILGAVVNRGPPGNGYGYDYHYSYSFGDVEPGRSLPERV